MNQECYMRSHCKGRFCDHPEKCMIKFKMDHFYDEANIPEKWRYEKNLYVDKDGTDLEAFECLNDIKETVENFVQTGQNLYIHSIGCGNGKAQPDDSLILTDHGYVKMRDIQIGDKLFGEDGKLHKIIGKYDRGIKDIYKITFNDRTSCLCCDEHLWNISDRARNDKAFKTVELKDLLAKDLHRSKGYGWRYQIPVTSPLYFPKKDFILHPYLLGYIIGDGCTGNNQSVILTINNNDAEDILPYINSLLPDSYYVKSADNKKTPYTYSITSDDLRFGRKEKKDQFKNIIKDELKKYNIIDNKTYDKVIPDDYLYSDIESRVSLLQGLMDTDGTVIRGTNNISFGNTSKKLVEQFQFLVQSLGGTVTTSVKKNRSYKYHKSDKSIEIKPAADFYYCQVKLPRTIIPFKLSRKVKNYNNNQQNEPYRAIHNIEFYGKEHCYCIMTDNPTHLYLTNNCIVTHNTSWAIKITQEYLRKIWYTAPLGCRVLFISVPKLMLALKDNIQNKNEYAQHILDNVYEADLVIWDDIGTKSTTQFEAEHLFTMIDSRNQNEKANIFTSNLSPEDLHSVLGDRLYSRIINTSYDVEFKGGDKRGLIKGE